MSASLLQCAPAHLLKAFLAERDPEIRLEALRDLVQRWPDWPEPRLHLAEHLRGAGATAEAMACYAALLVQDPARVEALLSLGVLHLRAGNGAAAEPLLRRCCGLAPDDAQAQHAWGLCLMLLGRHADAYQALSASHRLDPSITLCGVHLADTAQALGCVASALAGFEAESRLQPGNLSLLTARAACLAHLGRRSEAIDLLEAATILDPQARVPAALFADMLARSTRQSEAEGALRRALALDPDNDDASMALSVVLMRLHRHTEAVVLLRALLDRIDLPVGPLCNLATALTALGQQQEAVDHARQAVAIAPAHPAPYRALCNALPYLDGVSGAELLDAARCCAARASRGTPAPCRTDPDPQRRLRVGLLSGMLRAHPVGWLTIAAFEQLDPSGFELIRFTPNLPDDPIGRRFEVVAPGFADTGSLDDAALATCARGMQIDIMIDLGGYGDFGRMPAIAHRLAPVQIKWVGMQNHSSGLPEMDWFITDRWETPPGFAGFYSERLLTMPDGYVCYSPPEDAPPPAGAPAQRLGHVTFGCYNNLAKITPRVIAAWSRILRAAPSARLILKTHPFNNADTCSTLRAAFFRHGVAPDRIELRGSSPHRELLRQYQDIDIVLDPFAYSGGLTTCEALWMGVPTLTLPGETFASRHSASHMSNVGLEDWVVSDEAGYIEQALARAADIPGLIALRATLRDRMRASPLCDAPRFGTAFGAALRATWHDLCARDQDGRNLYDLL